MKKLVLTAIASFCFFSSAFALSWSGLIDNNSSASSNHDFSKIDLNQSNGIYLSINSDLTEDGSLKLAAEGLYKYSFNFNTDTKKTSFMNIADCDLLKISGSWSLGNGAVLLNAGRFLFSDFSGSVFSQTSDGFYVSYDTLKIGTSLYGGYTGLLNRLNVSMVENKYESDDQFYRLCPSYIPVAVDFSYKALFETNTIGAQAEAFIPVSDENTIKAYGTLSFSGLLGTVGNYNAKFIAGSEKFENLMLDAKLDLGFFLGTSTMFSLGGEYVSGEQGGLKPFVTITSRSFGHSGAENGVIVPNASVIYAAGKIYAGLTEMAILKMPKDEVKLDGFDTGVNILYNLFSDVQIGCDIGAYICTENKERSNYSATLKASLAF